MTAPAMETMGVMHNGRALALEEVPRLEEEAFREAILVGTEAGHRVVALFAAREAEGGLGAYAVLADDAAALLRVARMRMEGGEGGRWRALTPECPQVHLFEREMAERFGITLVGHPWAKPVRFEKKDGPRAGEMEFYRVEGEEVHEVAVGPVHAGIIEPGHFRFQCHGETVFHLEIALGYQHRGVEGALAGGPNKRSIHYAETLAGDTTVGHATAYCQIIEALTEGKKTARAQALRGVALELERLANHVGDLGALAGDVGFLPTASFCGRLRGDFLNMTATLCGNRFGRGLLRPGGVRFDASAAAVEDLRKRLEAAERDCGSAIRLLWDSPSVMARFEETGILAKETAERLGLVGPAARASGLLRDARQDHPWGIYRFSQIPAASAESGDVLARAYVRWLEVQRSLMFVKEQLAALPGGEIFTPVGALGAGRMAVSLVEGWRGELCHVAITDGEGKLARYKVVDPSFHNWAGLAMAMRGGQISDFPLCNKSFNLSYCGHDL